jgi:hypothetical protein
MDRKAETLIAQRPEHCMTCYRLIHIGETYHQTEEGAVLCQQCVDGGADLGVLDTLQATEELAVDVGAGGLRVRRGAATVAVSPGEVRHLVAALVEGAARLVDQQSPKLPAP